VPPPPQFSKKMTEQSQSNADRTLVRSIQKHLSTLGYYNGPIDGIAGKRTIAAVKQYQGKNGIGSDGVISESLLALLKISLAIASAPQEKPQQGNAVSSTGSGFVIGKSYAITNNHVIEDCREIRVFLQGGVVTGTVVTHDADDDVAVIKLTEPTTEKATFKETGKVRLGEDVVVVGFPLRGLLADDLNVSTGTVSALAGPGNDARFLQISAPVQPGNSGGPLLDDDGNVIGMVVSKLNAVKVARVTGDIPQNVNFAIKAPVLKSFLDIHGIAYDTKSSGDKKSTEDIVEEARSYTVPIECYQ